MAITLRDLRAMQPGDVLSDGGGLMVRCRAGGALGAFLRVQIRGRRVERGLGGLHEISSEALAEKREAARVMREKAFAEDRVPEKQADFRAAARQAEMVVGTTFREVAERLIELRTPGWKHGGKSAAQWRASLEQHVYPHIGDRPVGAITVDDAVAILEPLWSTKPETASRVRARSEAAFDSAIARSITDRANPFAWKGRLALLLPAKTKVHRVKSHASMPWADVPAFYAELCDRGGSGPAALRFLILTAARSGEVRHARWHEIDTEARLWSLAEDRTKQQREHRVHLTDAALAALDAVRPAVPDPDGIVFPGWRGGPMSDATLGGVLKRAEQPFTAHGFRSSFRSWVTDTGGDERAAEACLGHQVGGAVERAYDRSDRAEARRELLEAWAAFVIGAAAHVV